MLNPDTDCVYFKLIEAPMEIKNPKELLTKKGKKSVAKPEFRLMLSDANKIKFEYVM